MARQPIAGHIKIPFAGGVDLTFARHLARATTPDIITITPNDADVPKISHLGFFRPEHRDTLWRSPPKPRRHHRA
jgi:hypothetical protein